MLVWTINYLYGHTSYRSFSRWHIPSLLVTSIHGPTKLLLSWMAVLTPRTWVRQLISLGRKSSVFIFLYSHSRQSGMKAMKNHRTEMQWFWWPLLCLVSDTSIFASPGEKANASSLLLSGKKREKHRLSLSLHERLSIRIRKIKKLEQNQCFILNHLVLLLQQVIPWVLFRFVCWWACHFFCVSSCFRWVSLVTWRIRSCPCTLKSWSCRRALMEDVRETWWSLCKKVLCYFFAADESFCVHLADETCICSFL